MDKPVTVPQSFTKVTGTVKKLLNSGHNRSVKARKNILISFFIKGVSIAIGFIFVPLLINYLGTVEYGIWITLSSIVGWISYFDIGLGNGLRNRFAESLAKGKHFLARVYVSTTYAGLTLAFGGFFIIYLFINPLLDWSVILNTPATLRNQLSLLVLVTVGFFLMRFVLKLLAIIITADQRPAISNTFEPIGNVLSLAGVLMLMHWTSPSLLNLGIVLGASPVIVLIVASVYFFRNDYKAYTPSFKYINFKYFKDLAGLGFRFFIIQITIVVVLSTNNIIIAHVVGPEAVTSYNVAYRFFGIITMGFAIVANTYWSAFTEAYVKNDIPWIRRTTGSLLKMWAMIGVALLVMLLLSEWFYEVWVGEQVRVPFSLSFNSAIFVLISIWISIFTNFINSTGKIRLQLYSTVFAAIISIPLSIYLASNLGMGAAGVVLGSTLAYVPVAILAPLQYRKIVMGKDKGIWGK